MYSSGFIEYCKTLDCRLTSLRKYILSVLWQADRPLKAYEILGALLESKKNSKPATVYRVLDYFVSIGLVHKIESIQSYTLCGEPIKRLPSEILMVCNNCHLVLEAYDPDVLYAIRQLAQRHFFSLGEDVIEIKGLCQGCVLKAP